ncbi:MAG TPA: NfeD family protein [Acidimicrobiales bacterium]|nr:NfeD family protein [Acidimicrobiales bacterium]
MAVVWLVLGLVLIGIELHHWAFFALFAALGAFAAALVAAGNADALGLQCAVAVAVSGAGVLGVRPFMSSITHRQRGGHVAIGVHGGIVGQNVLTLDEVGDSHHVGHALLAGEKWLATSGSGQPIPAHTRAVVTAVSGTTLVLWSIDDQIEGIEQ